MRLRLVLWAIDMALPSGSDLQQRYRWGLMGLMAAVAGGVLLAAFGMGAIAGLGFVLYQYGEVSAEAAIAATALCALVLAAILFWFGKSRLSAAFALTPPDRSQGDDNPFRELLHGFVEGFAAPPPSPPHDQAGQQPYLYKEAV